MESVDSLTQLDRFPHHAGNAGSRRGIRRTVVPVLFGLGLAAAVRGADWTQWRGPDGQGVSSEESFPLEWGPTKNVLWRTEIPGIGQSSPVIASGRVYLTTAVEGTPIPGARAVKHTLEGEEFVHPDSVGADRSQTLRVLCLERDSGAILWDRKVREGIVYDGRHRKGSFASPTQVTDGERVYSYFGSEGVYCHAKDGNELWRSSVGMIATLGMGVGSSPVLHGGLIILQRDEDNGESSAIVALRAETGEEVWRTRRKVQVSWTTPVIIRSGARPALFAAGTELLAAYDPANGLELWRARGLESNAIHTPLHGDGLVIASAGYPAKRVIALRAEAAGDVTDGSTVAWTYTKGTSYVASPLLHRGHVYLVSDRGVVSCLDARTGKVRYDDGRVPAPAMITSSPVAYGDRVLITSEQGETFTLRAGEKFEVAATSSVGEPVHASLALSGGKIFIRGTRHLFCIAERGA